MSNFDKDGDDELQNDPNNSSGFTTVIVCTCILAIGYNINCFSHRHLVLVMIHLVMILQPLLYKTVRKQSFHLTTSS